MKSPQKLDQKFNKAEVVQVASHPLRPGLRCSYQILKACPKPSNYTKKCSETISMVPFPWFLDIPCLVTILFCTSAPFGPETVLLFPVVDLLWSSGNSMGCRISTFSNPLRMLLLSSVFNRLKLDFVHDFGRVPEIMSSTIISDHVGRVARIDQEKYTNIQSEPRIFGHALL